LSGYTGSGAILVIGDASSSGGLVQLYGNNTYAGGTSITSSTTLEVFQDDNLGAAGGGVSLASAGALLTDSTTAGGFVTSRDIFLTGNGGIEAVDRTKATYKGVVSGTQKLSVGSSFGGTVVFTAANTYAGGTDVNGGVLEVNNTSGSGTGSGEVLMQNGARLGGTGTLAPSSVTSGTAVEIAAGGILTPSNGSGASHLTFALDTFAKLILDAQSQFVFDLGSSTATSDEVLLTGGKLQINDLDLSDFTFNLQSGFAPGTTFTLFNSPVGIDGSLGSDVIGAVDGYDATIEFNSTDTAIDLNVSTTQAPEPSTWAMLLGGVGLLVIVRRQRRCNRSGDDAP
jgi:fibronectin-binding autotransporter adhesin